MRQARRGIIPQRAASPCARFACITCIHNTSMELPQADYNVPRVIIRIFGRPSSTIATGPDFSHVRLRCLDPRYSCSSSLTIVRCHAIRVSCERAKPKARGYATGRTKGPYSERKSESREEKERDRPGESTTRARGCERARD